MEICSSYWCAVRQQKCTEALVKAKCIPPCSVLLCKTGSQQVCVTAITPMKICSSYRCAVSQHQWQCSTGQGKMQSPMFSAALQNRLTACWFHCSYTYGDYLFIQVCSEPTKMHCITGQGKMHSPLFSAALQNRLTAGLCHCNYTYEDLLFIQVCSEPTSMAVQHWSRQNAVPYVQWCSGKQAHSRFVSLQ